MAIVSKTELKGYFETGDYPTESNFEDLIDSLGDASSINITPSGNISSTNVQSAIQEIDEMIGDIEMLLGEI